MAARSSLFSLFLVASLGCTETTKVDGDAGESSGGGGGTKSGGSGGGGGGDSSGGTGGGKPTGDSDAATFDRDASLLVADGSVPCGVEPCEPGACCADPFAGICGVPIGENGCLMPSPEDTMSDDRCPSVDVMGLFTIPSCCTEDGQCGIDATNFGGGCVELSVAADMAAAMGGGFIMWPSPRPCE